MLIENDKRFLPQQYISIMAHLYIFDFLDMTAKYYLGAMSYQYLMSSQNSKIS